MKLETGATVRVEVSKDRSDRSHFPTGFTGLLGRSYRQKYGHGFENEWTVFHPEKGGISWYRRDDLTVIAAATPESELNARRLEDWE